MNNKINNILIFTNVISFMFYYNENINKNIYKRLLDDKNISHDNLLIQYNVKKKDLEEFAIQMKNNDYSNIDKYINFGCRKCYNNKNIKKDMHDDIWETYSYCKCCLRCNHCCDKLYSSSGKLSSSDKIIIF